MTLILIDKSMQKKNTNIKKAQGGNKWPIYCLVKKKNKKKSYGYEYDIKIIYYLNIRQFFFQCLKCHGSHEKIDLVLVIYNIL